MALADTLKTDLNAPVVRPSQQYEKETIVPLRERMMTALESEENVGRKKEIQQASSQANLSASMSTYDTQASEKLHNDPNLIKYQEAIDQKSKAAFIPDQENPQRLATVLAITNLLGIAIGGKGKNSAQTALAAQNGMLEGYQQGRADIIKQQKDIFDTNQKQLDKTIENLHRGFQDALALAPTDRKAAEEKAMSTINQENADFLRELYNKTGLVGASKTIAELLKQAESRQKLMQQEEMKMIRTPHELAIERHELEMERQGRERLKQGERGLDIRENKQGPGGGGVIQFRYNGAVATAADKLGIHLENLASAASTSEVPRVGDVLTSERTVPTAMIKYFATTLTEPQNRALQQELAPTIREIANIESAGRPGGVTQASVNELGKMAPVGGDQKINYYMFLALAKQEAAIAKTTLEVSGGTKEQIDAAQKAIDKINKKVSWDVKDINRILTGPDGNTLVNDKMQNMLSRSNGLDQFNTFVEQQKTGGGAKNQSPIDPTTGYPTINARGYVLKRDKNGAYAYVGPNNEIEEIQ